MQWHRDTRASDFVSRAVLLFLAVAMATGAAIASAGATALVTTRAAGSIPACPGAYQPGEVVHGDCAFPSSGDGATLRGPSVLPMSPSYCPAWLKPQVRSGSGGPPNLWCSRAFSLTITGSKPFFRPGASYFGEPGAPTGLIYSEAGPFFPTASGCSTAAPSVCSGTSTMGPLFLEETRADLVNGRFSELVIMSGIGYTDSNTSQYVLDLPIQPQLGAAAPPPGPASLAVALTTSVGKDGVGVGDQVTVTEKVTAVGGRVSGIKDTLKGVGVASATGKSSLTLNTGLTLRAGASKSATFKLKAVKAGTATLTADVSGTSGSGATVSGSDSVKFKVGLTALAISAVTSPKTIRLSVDDKGKVIPFKVTVTAKLINKTKSTLKGIQLLSLSPEPIDKTQALDQLAFAKGTFPISIGTLAPGQASKPIVLPLEVTGDGEYRFRALAIFNDPSLPGGNGRAVALGGDFKVVVPPLFFSSEVSDTNITKINGDPYVKGGSQWFMTGTIKNESSFQRLCVLPLTPTLTGNAGGTGPADITVAVGAVGKTGGPFAGALEPGKSVSLIMFVDTSRDGASVGKVSFSPAAAKLDPSEACDSSTVGSMTMLPSADVTVPTGASSLVVHVDTSQTLTPPSYTGSGVVNYFGGFGAAFFTDTFDQVLDVVALARSADSTPAEYKLLNQLFPGAQAGTLVRATVQAAQAINTATDVYASYWKTASAADKQNVISQTASVLSRVAGDFFKNANQTVIDAATPWMTKLENAYATGDDAQVWNLWGHLGGSLTQQIVMAMFMEKLGAQMTANAPALEQTAAAETKAWEATEQAAEATVPANAKTAPSIVLTTVPPGTELTLAEESAVWGVDKASDAGLAAVSADNDVLVGVRGRSPGAIEKLEQGSQWKHEGLKPKNVNDIDVEYLGFRKADLSEVRFRTYTQPQIDAIKANVANSSLSAEDKLAVLARLQTRIDEAQYVPKIEGYSKKGQINVGFNYRENGINRPTTAKVRKFDLLSTPIDADPAANIPAGGTYYTPYQENLEAAQAVKAGGPVPPNCKRLLLSILCTITGDVDGVYVTTVDGGPVPPAKLIKVYKELQALGWQHPETLTWVNNQGQFFFGAKKKILAGLQQGGGEAMIEFAPDGKRRATYLDLAKSTLIDKSGADYRVSVVGGYSDYLKK